MWFVTTSHDARDCQTTVRNPEKASSPSGAGSQVIYYGTVREKDKVRVYIVSLVPRKNVNLVLPAIGADSYGRRGVALVDSGYSRIIISRKI